MQEIIIIFLLGCLGTFIRYFLSSKGIYYLLLANCIGVACAAICFHYDFNLLLAGFCGSVTTLSTLVVLGYKDIKYYILTILINFLIFYFIINIL